MIMKPLANETKRKGYYGDDKYIEKALDTAADWIEKRARQVQRFAAAARRSPNCHPLVERVCKLLDPPYQRPTHDLLCERRKCDISMVGNKRFWSYLKQEIEWGKEGHII